MKNIILLVVIFVATGTAALSQNVGIGTTTPPGAKLEVKGAGLTSLTSNLILRNSSGDTLFRVRDDGRMTIGYTGTSIGRTVNLGGNGINFYKTDTTFGGAVFPTDTSLVIWSNSIDDNYVILQPSWGNVGIGTFSPDAKLHVNGPVILGDSGTVIRNMIKVTMSKNLASVAANSASIETFTVAGATIGSTVHISPGTALADGLLISYARVSAPNTVEVKFMNVTAAAINHGVIAFSISIIE
jgi:hypothetical protein